MLGRKAETRRKIQLGGLIIKAGLEELPTAVLLGLLSDAADLLDEKPEATLSRWRLKGDIFLTRHPIK